MASGQARGARGARTAVLEAVAGWVPGEPVRNETLPAAWGVDDQWVRTRTGIASRHRAGPGTATGDLAYEAARLLIGDAGGGAPADPVSRRGPGAHQGYGARGGLAGSGFHGGLVGSGIHGGPEGSEGGCERAACGAAAVDRAVDGVDAVDAVVLATATPDHPCPATAPELAARLGLGAVPAFDLGAVCSGFVYGLAVCHGLVVSGLYDRVLLVGADTYSTWLDPRDRSAGVVFGDGAGAALIAAGRTGSPGELLGFDLGSDGSGRELITVAGGGSRARSRTRHPAPERSAPAAGSDRAGPAAGSDAFFRMRGRAVYQHAVERMTGSCRSLLTTVGWDAAEVDHFVPHQANARILRAVADRVGIGADRCVTHLDRVGNTGAASIPLALADAAARGRFRAGDRVLLTAFGGGLTWGTAALSWPGTVRAAPLDGRYAPWEGTHHDGDG
ncbi:beta-ketoacyl-ACP synthase 3 [Streptomyces sp. NPDC096310]|uniref:beta-ketoacyl-ACP synthase 3 n=1 Tax=Streptomyces sp. NPDC096310 TaxID=3366082 RepID=UPI00380FBB7C